MLAFERRVALRFLREGRMQSLLIVVGVAGGVAVVTQISGLIGGLQASTLEKTLGAQAHVTIRVRDEAPVLSVGDGTPQLDRVQPREQRPRSLAGWPALAAELEGRPGVAAVSPMVSTAGLGLRGVASASIALVGVDLDRYDRIVRLRDKVIAGQARLEPGEAIIGRELAADLGLAVGDRLAIMATAADADEDAIGFASVTATTTFDAKAEVIADSGAIFVREAILGVTGRGAAGSRCREWKQGVLRPDETVPPADGTMPPC